MRIERVSGTGIISNSKRPQCPVCDRYLTPKEISDLRKGRVIVCPCGGGTAIRKVKR